ncbi:hypothetical protein [Streptomyces minutiscleroticus]|uniref:hypothetical protein n=1 Tax=Streptomyces minutiscleroticus TaxID=68238 RepID=UPI00332EC35F
MTFLLAPDPGVDAPSADRDAGQRRDGAGRGPGRGSMASRKPTWETRGRKE